MTQTQPSVNCFNEHSLKKLKALLKISRICLKIFLSSEESKPKVVNILIIFISQFARFSLFIFSRGGFFTKQKRTEKPIKPSLNFFKDPNQFSSKFSILLPVLLCRFQHSFHWEFFTLFAFESN